MLKILATAIAAILIFNLLFALFLLYHYFYLTPKWQRERAESIRAQEEENQKQPL